MYLTEKEILERQQANLFGIQKIIRNTKIDLDDVTCLIPGMVHLNKIHTLELNYIDRESRDKLGVNREDLLKHGHQILLKHVKPESFQQAKKKFGNMKFDDPSQVVSHFQALKGFTGKSSYEWFYSVKKRFNEKFILTVSNPLTNFGAMQKQVEKILEDNQFIKKNLPRIGSLTKREKEVIKLISQGYNSNQIAEILFLSPHTIRTHRKNIWQKLEINSYAELLKISHQFEIE